jgi:hypothetical protein
LILYLKINTANTRKYTRKLRNTTSTRALAQDLVKSKYRSAVGRGHMSGEPTEWRPQQGCSVTLNTGQVVEIKIVPGSQTAHVKGSQTEDLGTFRGQQLLQWSNDSNPNTAMLRADLTCEVDGVVGKLPSGTLMKCTLEGTGLVRTRTQTEGVAYSKEERSDVLFTFNTEIVTGENAFRNYTDHLAAQGKFSKKGGKKEKETAWAEVRPPRPLDAEQI